MQMRCERRGQSEMGILEQDGRVYAAFGASVHGHNVTAYTSVHKGRMALATWGGKVMLVCRSEVVRTFWDGFLAIVFKLTNDRYIVGYDLGDKGMLFRGELLVECDQERADREALGLTEYWIAIDAEDEADPRHGEPTEPEGSIFS